MPENASKIEYYGKILIDLTEDSVTPGTLVQGITTHDKTGKRITGTFEVPIYEIWVFTLEDNSTVEKEIKVGTASVPVDETWTLTKNDGSTVEQEVVVGE